VSENENHHNHAEGEFRSGGVAGTAIINGATFTRKALQYAEVDGLAIFEGDIVLGTVEELQRGVGTEAVFISGTRFRWPDGVVPYEIDPGLPNQQRVTDAIAHWEANTSVRFVQRTASHTDFVRFVDGGGCSSAVGRRGGQQTITLGSGCSTGNAIHEIGHTVGLWHEQSREDRDTFVRIVWANIDPAMQHNFNQHVSDGDDVGPYDYGSVMHYPATAFSINGQPTIEALQPLPPGVVMGQRSGLSPGDIAAINQIYPARPVTIKELPKDPVQDPTVKELVKDPIQDPTIKEMPKDPIRDPTLKEMPKDPIRDPVVGPVGPVGPGPLGTPFVLATPPQAPMPAQPDLVTQLVQVVQQLGAAIAAIDQERATLAVQYDAAVAQLRAALGESG
jgi:hypothetical protein